MSTFQSIRPDGALAKSRKHDSTLCSRSERERRGPTSQSDHWATDGPPEGSQPPAPLHASAAPAFPASPVQKLPRRSVRVHDTNTGRSGGTHAVSSTAEDDESVPSEMDHKGTGEQSEASVTPTEPSLGSGVVEVGVARTLNPRSAAQVHISL